MNDRLGLEAGSRTGLEDGYVCRLEDDYVCRLEAGSKAGSKRHLIVVFIVLPGLLSDYKRPSDWRSIVG